MSASQDKKRRTDERALGTERRQVASQKEAKERKQSKIKWTVGSIIVVLLVVAILLGNSSLFYTARPALQVGDVKYSSAEVNYAYRTAYLSFCNQYGNYLTYVKLDTSKPLDEQECGISDEFDTWDDYFRDAAEKNLVQVTALCDAAEKAGVSLDEDDQHEVDEQFSYIAVWTNFPTSGTRCLTQESKNPACAKIAQAGFSLPERVIRPCPRAGRAARARARRGGRPWRGP